ncbi:unnamed protein product, partial [Citrullus colocynthis]
LIHCSHFSTLATSLSILLSDSSRQSRSRWLSLVDSLDLDSSGDLALDLALELIVLDNINARVLLPSILVSPLSYCSQSYIYLLVMATNKQQRAMGIVTYVIVYPLVVLHQLPETSRVVILGENNAHTRYMWSNIINRHPLHEHIQDVLGHKICQIVNHLARSHILPRPLRI